jgi:hypothetical protein
MAGQELDFRAEQMDAHQASNLSSMLPELLQNNSFRQQNQFDSAATIANNGFPQFELFDGGASVMKADSADSAHRLNSKYETGAELTSDRELKQAGLNPKDVKHTIAKKDGGWTEESTSAKYPGGLEVTVTGRTKHMPSGNDVVMEPEAKVKEPLPKNYRKDKDGAIFDGNNKKVAQINDDGTVTVKVGKDYVTQGPAGVVEETVLESKSGAGMIGRIKVKH